MEDAPLSPVDPSPPDPKEVFVQFDKSRETRPDALRQIIAHSMNDGSLVSNRCKICQSSLRKDVEEMHEKGRPLVEIKEFLDSKEESVALSNISHHLKEHYKNMDQLAMLMDYCDRLDEIKQKRRDRAADIDMMVRVCMLELARVIAIPTKNDISREKIRTELILKVNSSITDNIKILNDMEDQDQAIRSYQVKLAEAWESCVHLAPQEEKKFYANVLRTLQQMMESSD